VRPMGPGCSARIARFLSTQFSSNRTGSTRLEIRSLQKFLLVRVAMLLLSAATPSPSLAHAQSQPATVFRFSKEVHWGRAVLPPGDYVVSVSADASPVVTVGQKGSAFTATIAPKTVSSAPFSGNTRVVMSDDGHGNYVTSLYVKDIGAVLTFAAPNARPQAPNPGTQDLARQDAVFDDSASSEGGLFTIYNPRSQTVPYAEAQAIYLSACKAVEQEFSRTDPVRPRLTLLLGAGNDRVYYPKREIQLTKWDKYQFAEGVVLLAVDDLLTEDKKISLTRLAVLEADSTVDISELKSSRTPLHAGPRN
jgi:hypothetical protein